MVTEASNGMLRTLDVLKALKGHSLTGLSNKEIADALHISPSAVTRALATLIESGLATKLESGRFAHSVQMLQIAFAHSEHISRTQNRMDELQRRISAGSH